MSVLARLALGAVIAVPCALLSREARATPDFPSVVQQALELEAITIDPPNGCTLCHTSDAGGTSLRTFGSLMQQYGAQPYDEGSLKQALGELGQNEPQLIADIKAGKDPNEDSSAGSAHTPEYGCAAGGQGDAGASEWWAPALALGAAVAWGRRRRACGTPALSASRDPQ
ncbi:MAG TPA: hypothetical protein VGI39_11670 [Polyangiaceae bacterium]